MELVVEVAQERTKVTQESAYAKEAKQEHLIVDCLKKIKATIFEKGTSLTYASTKQKPRTGSAL